MSLGFIFSAVSGAMFMLRDFILLELHKIVAIGVFVASLLHIYSKRKKPIKLFNKFLDVVLSSKNSSFCYGVFSGRDGKLYRKVNPSEKLDIDCA